jgi:AcrR family transcriptional regulator
VSTAAPTPPGPRAPRRRLPAELRRGQLIDAAITVIAREGYARASTAAIAAEAGVAKGLLWRYFADGEDLMEQAARRTLVALRETVADGIDLAAPVPQVIRAAIARAVDLRRTHPDQLRALREIAQHLRQPDGTPRLGIDDYEQTYSLQATLFQRGVDEGTLRPVDTRVLAVTYQAALDAMLAYLDRHPDVDPTAYAAAVADILLVGIER